MPKTYNFIFLLSIVIVQSGITSNQPESANGRKTAVPSVTAYDLNGASIKIDGVLDEDAWSKAELATGFRIWSPNRGAVPIRDSDFKVLYDQSAVYFGVRCYEDDPEYISENLNRRDQIDNSDFVGVYIDSYDDNITAYNFMITASGVLGERYVYQDGNMDSGWDAVWEARVHRADDGWYAEYRIPFACLRIRHSDDMTWGLNVYRYMHSRGEDTGWTVWDRQTRGFVSRFGQLKGLKGIPQTRQLEITPYIAHSTTDPSIDPVIDGVKDEFDHAENFGMDMKLGITPNLTLNATFQPDFGQVEADPSELNLSPFETMFDEKRPFFLEGAQYFWHPDYIQFYSRRIGTGDANSRIRAAGKLIGKTANDISLAMLYANTDITGNDQSHNFLKSGNQNTHYLFGKFGREFADGANQFSIAQSAVIRRDISDKFGNRNRNGYTTGADFDLNLEDRRYKIHGSFIGSIIDPASLDSDTTSTMQNMQSKRYGTGGVLKMFDFSRQSFWYGLIFRWEDEDLDINDFGFKSSNDKIRSTIWTQYQYNSDTQTTPLLSLEMEAEITRGWFYAAGEGFNHHSPYEKIWSYGKGLPQFYNGWTNIDFQFRNYWFSWVGISVDSRNLTKYETRRFNGARGPLFMSQSEYSIWTGFATDYRQPYMGKFKYDYGSGKNGNLWHNFKVENRWIVSDQISVNLDAMYNPRHYSEHHYGNYENPANGIGGVSYVFAELDQDIMSLTLRSDILFSNNLSLQLYAQPFYTTGMFSSFRELKRPNTHDLGAVVGLNNPDFENYEDSFEYAEVNVNMVLRWEFALGSTAYLVWKHGRTSDDRVSGNAPIDEFDLEAVDFLRHEPENVILFKVSKWFSM